MVGTSFEKLDMILLCNKFNIFCQHKQTIVLLPCNRISKGKVAE